MEQLFLEKGSVKKITVPIPPLKPHSILVKVHYSFISTGTEGATVAESKKTLLQKCLTDTTDKLNKVMGAIKSDGLSGTVALVKGSLNKVLEIGYSCSGEVVEVGEKIQNFKVGDFVACAGSSIANHAEYISVPKHLAIKLDGKAFLKEASLTTIGAIALQGIRRAQLNLGESVCVIGLGLIGQLTTQLAKQTGCTVYGVDIDDSKLFLAQKLGCDHVYNSYNVDVVRDLLFHTQHNGVDTTIITAASPSGKIIQQAMEITRKKGRVVLVGDVKIDFDRSPFYQKEIDFLISCSYGPGRYDASYEQQGIDYPYSYVRWTENRNMQLFAKLVYDKKIIVDPLISEEFSFTHAERAYESLSQRRALGLLLRYDEVKTDVIVEKMVQPITSARSYKTPHSNLSIAVIGAGGFAKIKLLPILSKIKGTRIHSIIDTDPTTLINIAKQYQAQSYHNDYTHALLNEDVNAVIIATPHAIHTQQTISALSAGKAVFVEKPAAVSWTQYEQLSAFLSKSKEYLYCVDFNRSFAPFIMKIKEAVKTRTTPLVIHYRMNAGFIPKDHWIQSDIHGGRVIGEACHIFELFSFLTDSRPKHICANAIDTTREDLLSSDNFSAQIVFHDGSLCTLLYTSIGNPGLDKERMEIFFDGKSIVMDDYKTLCGYGLPKSFNETSKFQDKGHQNLLTQFVTAAQYNTPSPLSVERILSATRISLEVNQCLSVRK